jgi:NADP-dependent 3-hydroxy acid dehydrogenase YdfG
MKVNTLAPIFLTSQLFDLIKENEADIMNVGSTVGRKAYANQCAYATSKWALRGTSLNLQLELMKTKCRVIQFNP